MQLIHNLLKFWSSITLVFVVVLSVGLFPPALMAADIELPSDVSSMAKNFSVKYCAAIPTVGDPKKAVEVTSRQMISELIFSGVMKKVMTVPKNDMAEFVAIEIFDECGNELSISQQELSNYLFELADSGEDQARAEPKPFKPFGVG